MKILVAGASGQVAQALKQASLRDGEEVVVSGRPDLDLADEASVVRAIAREQPDVVVNAAAFTNVEAAEDEPEEAHRMNALGAKRLAASCPSETPFIHLSTDYVFDGAKAAPYVEGDVEHPINAYGASKLAGERMVAECHANHIILRTSWVYSAGQGNFLRTMLKVARDRHEVRVIDDQVGAPTSAVDIAGGVLGVVRSYSHDGARAFGLFHMTAGGDASWADFAEAIFEESGRLGGPVANVVRIPSADYPTKAARPLNSRLDCAKLRDVWGVVLPHWRDSVGANVAQVLKAEASQ